MKNKPVKKIVDSFDVQDLMRFCESVEENEDAYVVKLNKEGKETLGFDSIRVLTQLGFDASGE